MAALLRLAAMLVSNAAFLLRMRPSRLPGECHADATPQTLPEATSSPHNKEQQAAATNSHASRNSADVLLPRAGEVQSVRTAERSGPGGGPPHRLVTAPPALHRIVPALRAMHASLPRSGEEDQACVTS